MRSNLINMKGIAAVKVCFQRALMEYAQRRQSMKTRNSKNGLPTFMLCDTPDAPSTESSLTEDSPAKSAVTLVILSLPASILIRSEESISPTDTHFIKSSFIRQLV